MEAITESVKKIDIKDRPRLAPQRPYIKMRSVARIAPYYNKYKQCEKEEKNTYCDDCKSCIGCGVYIDTPDRCEWCTEHNIKKGDNLDTHHCALCDIITDNTEMDDNDDCDTDGFDDDMDDRYYDAYEKDEFHDS